MFWTSASRCPTNMDNCKQFLELFLKTSIDPKVPYPCSIFFKIMASLCACLITGVIQSNHIASVRQVYLTEKCWCNPVLFQMLIPTNRFETVSSRGFILSSHVQVHIMSLGEFLQRISCLVRNSFISNLSGVHLLLVFMLSSEAIGQAGAQAESHLQLKDGVFRDF